MTGFLDPGQPQTEKFREGIARRLGLHFDESRWGFLAEVLQRRLDRTGTTGGAYLDRLDSAAPFGDELRELARELTVGETYFFRNIDQFRAVAEVVLPERFVARAAVRTLNFLSAGCASGEEPYSLAMLARERIRDPRWTVSILGVDINPLALEKAAAARYSPWSLRETPADAQARWFQPQGRDLLVDPAIRNAVKLEERNLAVEDPALFPPSTYDVIFCRNVIMYFTLETARAVVARLSRALVPGGYLFLGHAETLRGLSHDFHLRHTHGTFYYQRRDEHQEAGAPPPVSLDSAWSPSGGEGTRDGATLIPGMVAEDANGGSDGWIDNIRRASERIQALAGGGAPSSDEPIPSAAPIPRPDAPDLTPIMESLAHERFAEALGLFHALPTATAGDPDSLLLRAALLTHSGQLDAAQQACAELLALDELNAGAHYLLALCRESLGDRAAAIDHDQVAVYLDPAFAMPRLHMGLLARRSGQREVARRELGLALPLLQREDPSRLLLFGGGFNRDALTALCRAELGATTRAEP